MDLGTGFALSTTGAVLLHKAHCCKQTSTARDDIPAGLLGYSCTIQETPETLHPIAIFFTFCFIAHRSGAIPVLAQAPLRALPQSSTKNQINEAYLNWGGSFSLTSLNIYERKAMEFTPYHSASASLQYICLTALQIHSFFSFLAFY